MGPVQEAGFHLPVDQEGAGGWARPAAGLETLPPAAHWSRLTAAGVAAVAPAVHSVCTCVCEREVVVQ